MHLVIGTSGHIDHGKTTLVKALTGVDTDRLAEEKARGITIDLGFARLRDGEGNDLAFVDVPGHERFVHNMLAGAAGFDAVLMVVAADEGVMPQTREHLHICDLLGITRGVVALTRADLADPELLELSRQDVQEAVAGTFLAGAPILPVSAVTGQGLAVLKAALTTLARATQTRDTAAPFRFPVDRSFTMKGFGTVVTGTVVAGRLHKDEAVTHYPAGQVLRLRGLQVHGEPVERIEAGQRAAINLAGISKEEIQRGHQLAAPDSLLQSYMLNVELRLLEETPRELTQRTRVRFHLGTQEAIGRIVLLEGAKFAPGETHLIQMRLEEPVAARYGDRYIVRNFSPVFTLGGGRIIDPMPSKSRRIRHELVERLRGLAGDDPAERVEQVAYLQGARGIRGGEGFIRTGLGEKEFARALQGLASKGRIFNVEPAEKRYIHEHTLERIARFIERSLELFHRNFPEREGMTRAELAGKLSLIFGEREVGTILARLVKQGRIAQREQSYRLVGHEKSVSADQEALLARCIEIIQAGGMQPPRKSAVFDACHVDDKLGQRLVNLGTHSQRLVRVKDDLYYTPDTIASIESRLREYLHAHASITVIDFKELTGVTRKHAVDLLEHFDAQHVTLRLENHRVLRQG
ncbi:MAG: selenocysteine-specific translation elongation factor [Candidatus Lambdaproteobacteria bacterium]|nr:selenocysteine-specific translation elongation factor [Candidatus Lambdaproteobacteria bacterium]